MLSASARATISPQTPAFGGYAIWYGKAYFMPPNTPIRTQRAQRKEAPTFHPYHMMGDAHVVNPHVGKGRVCGIVGILGKVDTGRNHLGMWRMDDVVVERGISWLVGCVPDVRCSDGLDGLDDASVGFLDPFELRSCEIWIGFELTVGFWV